MMMNAAAQTRITWGNFSKVTESCLDVAIGFVLKDIKASSSPWICMRSEQLWGILPAICAGGEMAATEAASLFNVKKYFSAITFTFQIKL